MPRSDEDLAAEATTREAAEARVPLQQYIEQTDPYVMYAKQMQENPVQTIQGTTVEGDPEAAQAEIDAQRKAQDEIDAQQQQQEPVNLSSGGGGGGGFQSLISPGTREIYEMAFNKAATVLPEEVDRTRQANEEAEAIRQQAYDDARKQVAAQAGEAWGKFHQLNDETKHTQDVYQTAKDEADDAVKSVRETKIDPNRFWHEGDTFTNVMAAISVAMGGFFSVYTGQNPAADTINRAIDRDIRAQEADLKKKEGVSDTLLRRNLNISKDLESARERTRLQLLEVTRLTAQKMAMDAGNAQANANYAKLAADLQNRADQATVDLGLRYAQYKAQTEGRVAPHASLGVIGTADKDAAAYVPSLGGLARGGTAEAIKLRDDAAKTHQLQDLLEHAEMVRRQMGSLEELATSQFDPTKSAKYLQLQRDFAQSINLSNKLADQGAISHGDEKRAKEAVTDFGNLALSKEASLQALGVAKSEIGRQFQFYRESIIPATEHVVQYNGRIMRVYTQDVQNRPPPSGTGGVHTTPLTPKKSE